MLRYTLFAYMILDCFYQAFGNPISVQWSIFYDVSHYLFAFTIALWAALNLKELEHEAYIIMAYFGFISVNELLRVNMSWADYWNSKCSNTSVLGFSYLALTLIILFVLFKIYKHYIRKRHE